MIRWLFKYGYVLFLFNTILYSINFTNDSVAPIVFLLIMFLTLIFLLINPIQIREVLFHKSFLFLFFLNLINVSYFFFLDDISNVESIKYLMARAMQFSLISLSIYHNQDYFKERFLDHLLFCIYIVVLLSLLFYPDLIEGRYSGIIWNPNMLSSFTGIGFAILLLKGDNNTRWELFAMGVLLIVSLATGSRGVLISIILAFILKYGVSIRNIVYSLIALVIILVISNTNMDTSLNRIASQSLFNDRAIQFEYALETLKLKLWEGYGLSEYSGIPDKDVIPDEMKSYILTAHNGYMSIFLQFGLFFGFFVILIFLRKSISVLLFFRKERGYLRVYYFIIIFTLIAAFFESFITGINEFQTILFWFSLSILSFFKYNIENNEV